VKTRSLSTTDRALNPFLQQHQDKVMGIVHGLDRVRFQGSLRYLYHRDVFREYLYQLKVLWKDFKAFACDLTRRVHQTAVDMAKAAGRPYHYLRSTNLSKEELISALLKEAPVSEGLVAVLSCVEPCRTYKVYGNRQTQKLELRLESSRCLHVYFYVQHRQWGLLHLRLQTWFPFLIHICVNGHERLARQMDEKGLRYERADNRFTWLKDFAGAQRLADEQLQTDWVKLCEELRRTYHPLHAEIGRPLGGLSYYWTAQETEYASDVLFHQRAVLDRLFPRLVRHGILQFNCSQVMRFLGKRLDANFTGKVVSDLRRRNEGVRLKHWVSLNSIKLYNSLNVLRGETTINHAEDLRVFRSPETRPDAPKAWHPLRRGVADLHRRAELSRAANERYLAAMAAANDGTALSEQAVVVCQPVLRKGRRHRALNPFNPADAQLLQLVNDGSWTIKGFRNRDLRLHLFKPTTDSKLRRRQAAQVTRRLALLHAHGLIAKISRTHRWQVTARGRRLITALLAARSANTEQLVSLAA
jgi:hypothetical protein